MAIHLLTGDDEALLRVAVSNLVAELVGDGDRSMMVDEFDGPDYELRHVVDAAQTPPFLSDKRVIVAREVGRFSTDEVTPLLRYLDDPLPTSDLVLAGGGGRLAKKLADAVKSVGTVTATGAPARPRDRQGWVEDQLHRSGLRVDRRAASALAEWLGEDAGRLDGIITTLQATFGDVEGALDFDDIVPFLGEAGGVPPWNFTDAIDRGDTTAALTMLGRMTHAGGRHPLQIMAVLHGHYGNLAKLDGRDVRSESEVMEATGIKSKYPAKKALENYRRLGAAKVKKAYTLLAVADLDLRGAKALPDEVVMEVLVARLSKLR